MELCTGPHSLPQLTLPRLRSFPPFSSSSTSFRCHSGFRKLVTRASSEDSGLSGKPFWPTEVNVVVEDSPPKPLVQEEEKFNENTETLPSLQQEPSSPADVDSPQNEFLSNFQLDSENTYTLILYGGGALVFLWLTSGVVRAVDSIPLFSKLMEVVGLGYATWFTIRYVLFKKNREELIGKFEDLKRQVVGPNDE